MPTSDFLPHDIGTGANVLTQADWAALPDRQTGFQAGTIYSIRVNKALRQSTAMAAALGAFIASRGPLDAKDDSNIAGLQTSYETALQQFGSLSNYGQDVGVVNSLVLTLSPSPLIYFDGLRVTVIPNTTNTTSAFLSVNGIGSRAICRRDGSPTQAGDLQQGAPYEMRYYGGASNGVWRLLGLGTAEVLRVVANPVIYVRTDGSDANDGTSNTPASAFRTIQAAYNKYVNTFSTSLSATIQLGQPGVYAAMTTGFKPIGQLSIIGDQNNQAAYIISGATGNGSNIVAVSGAGTVNFLGLTIQNTGTNVGTAACGGPVYVSFNNVTFQATATTSGSMLSATLAATVQVGNGCIFSGNATAAFFTNTGGTLALQGTISFVGTPTYSVATAFATALGQIQATSGSVTFSGTTNGARYISQLNAVINTAGSGANFFPGSSPGSVATGGIYN